MIAIGHSSVYVALANPDGTFGAAIAATPAFTYASSWTDANIYPRMVGDTDNDGYPDLLAVDASGIKRQKDRL